MRISKAKFDLIRAYKCLSVGALKEMGVTEGTLNSIRQHRQMRPENVGKLAHVLGVAVEDLIEME